MNASIFSRLTPEEITALHETWKNDPLSVDPLWAAYFEGYELGAAALAGRGKSRGRLPVHGSAGKRGRPRARQPAHPGIPGHGAQMRPLQPAGLSGGSDRSRTSGRTGLPPGRHGPAPSTSAPSRKGASSPSGKSSPTSGTPIAGPSDLNTSTLTTWKSAPGLRKK